MVFLNVNLEQIPDTTFANSACAEMSVLVLIFAMVVILFRLFGSARNWVVVQHDNMVYALINKSNIRLWQLQVIFPDDYFISDEDE